MLIKTIHNWELPEASATPEDVFWNRRQIIQAMGLGAATIGAGALGVSKAFGAADPTLDLYPAKRNDAYKLDRPITEEKLNLEYNNFYEFGSTKRIAEAAQALPIRPWEIKIDGLVEKEFTIGIDELIRKVGIEERLYRHRCVEAWSMTVPWSGFAMSKLVEVARPMSGAKYIRMETFNNPEVAPGQKPPLFSWSSNKLPWPYIEGVTMEEARNDLAFLVTGAYGKPVAKQMGAPLRLALPWEVRLQIDQINRAFQFHRRAACQLLGNDPAERIWFLGQREPGRAAPALEPGVRTCAGLQQARAHSALQRVSRAGRQPLHKPGSAQPRSLPLISPFCRWHKKSRTLERVRLGWGAQ